MVRKKAFQRLSTDTLQWDSPLGALYIELTSVAIKRISFEKPEQDFQILPCCPLASELLEQLKAYFEGRLRTFSLPLEPEGSVFQKEVWQALSRIPFGYTMTYSELCRGIGRPDAIRAVAGAIAANPLLIVIPCHRVLGRGGKLTGYAGGLERKRKLLEHERQLIVPRKNVLF